MIILYKIKNKLIINNKFNRKQFICNINQNLNWNRNMKRENKEENKEDKKNNKEDNSKVVTLQQYLLIDSFKLIILFINCYFLICFDQIQL